VLAVFVSWWLAAAVADYRKRPEHKERSSRLERKAELDGIEENANPPQPQSELLFGGAKAHGRSHASS
jgi:hypothetical protein